MDKKPFDAESEHEKLIRERNERMLEYMKGTKLFGMMVEFAKGRQKEERKRKRDSTQNAQNGTPPSAAKVPRRSLRSQGKRPSSSADDPGDGTSRQSFKSDKSSDEDKENIEGNKPKRYRLPTARPVSKAVEDITQPMLNNISRKVSTKVYGYKGTTCHQCRQKTLDQKTYCRNIHCIGLRGMFCGVCLKNRYGEDVAEALLDPNWRCPVCRGICNCSLCRELKGKRPTGVLMPLALKNGYSSVREFLMSLGT
ncbi:unnamed protein product, partial [Callosobruchus maculatus]